MSDQKKKSIPTGTENTKINVPITTMNVIREQSQRDGCSITHIVAGVLNAYARGEIRQEYTRLPGAESGRSF